ncbi:uncharacterized protein EDB91DRAFT_1064870, partial [Suillus paluster]|uniref:uncharacterized protein n=1 Tax=Suillus paluster TaxID=48578 RepID=UPI001B88227C
RSASLNNLDFSLRDRFEQRCVLSDLGEAMELHWAALLLRPSGHFDRSDSLDNFSISLRDRFKYRGVLSDLEEAIKLHCAALHLRPPGHSDRSASLNSVAASIKSRLEQWGVLSDLDEVIELEQAFTKHTPTNRPVLTVQTSSTKKNSKVGRSTSYKHQYSLVCCH